MKTILSEKTIKNAEDWHKENRSEGNIDTVKKLLKKETQVVKDYFYMGETKINTTSKKVSPIPILHNEGKIFLQFCGWSINLLDDGTWHWEDTTGG